MASRPSCPPAFGSYSWPHKLASVARSSLQPKETKYKIHLSSESSSGAETCAWSLTQLVLHKCQVKE